MRALLLLLAALIYVLLLTSTIEGKKDLPDHQVARKSTAKGAKLRECLNQAASTAEIKRAKGEKKKRSDYTVGTAADKCVNICSADGGGDGGNGTGTGGSDANGGGGARRLAQFERFMPMTDLLKLPLDKQREYVQRMLQQAGGTDGTESDADLEVVTFDEDDPDTLQLTEIAAENIPDDRLEDFCQVVTPSEDTAFFQDQIKKGLGRKPKDATDPGADEAGQDIMNIKKQSGKAKDVKDKKGGHQGNSGGRRKLLNADGSLGIELPEFPRIKQLVNLMKNMEVGEEPKEDGRRRLQQDVDKPCSASIPDVGKASPLEYQCDGIMVKPSNPGYTWGTQYGQYALAIKAGTYQSGKAADYTNTDTMAGHAITKLSLETGAMVAEKIYEGIDKGCDPVKSFGGWTGLIEGVYYAPQATACATAASVAFFVSYGLKIGIYPMDKINEAAGFVDGIVAATENEANVQNIIAIGNNQAVMQNYNQAQFTALTELVTELVKEVQAVKDAVNALDEKVSKGFCSTQNQLHSVQNRATHLHSLLLVPEGKRPGYNNMPPQSLLADCPYDPPIKTCGNFTNVFKSPYMAGVPDCPTVPLL